MKETMIAILLIGAIVCASCVNVASPVSKSATGPTAPGPTRLVKDAPSATVSEPPRETRDLQELQAKLTELRLERDLLIRKLDDLQRQLETAQQEIAGNKKTIADTNARLATVEKEKAQLQSALSEARDQARELATKLAAEQVKSATLREDKQRLMSGTTTAKEEIARLQKRASELESEKARADDLAKRLAERDQEIERLRKAAAERESLMSKIAALTDKLERTKQRVNTLTDELASRMRQEHDQLALETRKQQENVRPEERPPTAANSGSSRTEEFERLERERPSDKPSQEQARSASLAAPTEERRMAKEAESHPGSSSDARPTTKETSQALTAAQADLTKGLEADIAKGHMVIMQQSHGRLVISLVDRLLFDPGQRHVKPEGRKVLKKVSETVRSLPEKQVRIEGHVEDTSPGVKSKEQGGNAWELSTARATSIARYFLEEGGLDGIDLSIGVSAEPAPGNGHTGDEGHRIDIIVALRN